MKNWEKCVEFHGHECPGLAIGVKASEAAIEKLGISFSEDEEIVCVTENDACGVDGIQVLIGCTFGKGNLIYRDLGKTAYSFFKRSTGESLRMISKLSKGNMDREERIRHILNSSIDDLFTFSKPEYELPEKARIFDTIICEKCGEGAAEPKIKLEQGKNLCLNCYNK